MFPIWSGLLLAATAAAETTTAIWMPSPWHANETHIGFYASVVGVDGGKTTLALQFDNQTDLATAGYEFDDEPNTMTFFGSTRFESVMTSTAILDGSVLEGSELTAMYGCELASGTHKRRSTLGAVCRHSLNGPAMHSSFCDNYSDSTTVSTRTREHEYDDSTVVETTTIDYRTHVPDYCKSGASALPDSLVVDTYSIEKSELATFQVIITAGEEKLSATAGATVSNTPAMVTGTGAIHIPPTGTGAEPAQVTGAGAAGAMLPLHPAIAGLGAAAMAFLL